MMKYDMLIEYFIQFPAEKTKEEEYVESRKTE